MFAEGEMKRIALCGAARAAAVGRRLAHTNDAHHSFHYWIFSSRRSGIKEAALHDTPEVQIKCALAV